MSRKNPDRVLAGTSASPALFYDLLADAKVGENLIQDLLA
jgi:hypothetical protein